MENFNDNICIFNSNMPSRGDIRVLHVVLETKKQIFDGWISTAYYRMNYVMEGEGVFQTQVGDQKVCKGDIFLCLPSTPFAIQSVKNFRYAYISLMGERVNEIFHKFKFNVNNCVFREYGYLDCIWYECLKMPSDIFDLYAEGVFMTTASLIASKTLQFEKNKKMPNTAVMIKKYIEDNFSNPELSLETICKNFAYNNKYISRIFKKEFKVSFKEYLNTIRINNACALMNKKFSSVKDVAFLCGFSDPLYFSKVFKSKMKQSPTSYMATLH